MWRMVAQNAPAVGVSEKRAERERAKDVACGYHSDPP